MQQDQATTILIIDAPLHRLNALSDILNCPAFTVLTAQNGTQGIERARSATPDIIFIDAVMADSAGFGICSRLKAIEQINAIPVIFVIGATEMENRAAVFQSGGMDYITYPFHKQEILARLMAHLPHHRSNGGMNAIPASCGHRVTKPEETAEPAKASEVFERKIAEQARQIESLRSSESKFRAILDQSYSFVGLIGLNGRVLEANQSALSFIGKTFDEIRDAFFWETPWWNHSRELSETLKASVTRAAQGELIRFEATHPSDEGELHYIDFSLKPVRDQSGRVFMLTAEGRDITELKKVGEALAQSRNYLEKIINTVADPIFVKDRAHRFVLINEAFCSFTKHNRESLIGKSDYDFFPKEEADVFHANDEIVFKTGKENINEEHLTDAKGNRRTTMTKKTRYVDEKGDFFIVGIIRDVTESKRIEEQLRQAAKMEAIGTLAGGVAHDFNNMMMAVIGYSDLLLSMLEDDGATLCKHIRQIKKAGESAAALTQQLLAFSRKQVVQPRVVDLNTVLSGVKKMLARIIGEDITLDTRLAKGLWHVISDPVLIEQVVMNLAINARDAMPQGGRLSIETANAHLDAAYARQHVDVRPGDYVMIAVSDTGMGMDAATQSHIFEPFFTTKAKGKGSGLGMATVYGIVKQSGGHIWLYSEPGLGTTFKIFFPKSETELKDDLKREDSKPIQGGTETILVVEDNDTARSLLTEILLDYGYRVLNAPGGVSALETLDHEKTDIDLLITDVVMPEMDGRQVAESITQKFPDVQVLYISGYTDNAIAQHGMLDADTAFLQKPFSPKTLAEKVRRLLDGKRGAK